MKYSTIFSMHIRNRQDHPCLATMDAIDRIKSEFRDFFETMADPLFTNDRFVDTFMVAWKPDDILLATGRDVKWWYNLMKQNERNVS